MKVSSTRVQSRLTASVYERSHIERRLRNARPAGFFTVIVMMLIFQTVVMLMSGALFDVSSRRALRSEWSNTDQLQFEAAASRSLLLSPAKNVKVDARDSKRAPLSQKTVPIDNYYSRPHMTGTEMSGKPILFVGGSDGSGTRAVVATLMQLGVPMLVDDTIGYDVHALTLFKGEGWPPLVSAILNETGTANYEYEELPPKVKQVLDHELVKFRKQIELRASAKLYAIHKSGNKTTSKVSHGLKAPATMLLLPILRHYFGPMKFIHVVRDGRDVAFSQNQSPVAKFYNSYYKDFRSRREIYDNQYLKHVMAMELWNDWNVQAHHWEQSHNDGVTLDYLIMRSEDMLNPETRHKSIQQLADFVGSPLSVQEICCLSRGGPQDMGVSIVPDIQTSAQQHSIPAIEDSEEMQEKSLDTVFQPMDEVLERRMLELDKIKDVAPHLYEQIHAMQQAQVEEMKNRRKQRLLYKFGPRHRIEDLLLRQGEFAGSSHRQLLATTPSQDETGPDSGERIDVTQRYGRWMDKVRGKKELYRLLHQAGRTGLARFGYEPPSPFLDESHSHQEQLCETNVVCPNEP